MHWIAKISFYFRSLFSRRKQDAEMTEEMRVHLEMEAEARIAAGMLPEDAGYAAEKEFGNVASVQERTREERGWVWLEQWGKDVAFALRSLVRARGFSVTVVATLVLGISIAAVVLSAVNWILFRPLPFPAHEQLALIKTRESDNRTVDYCGGVQFLAYREQTELFSGFAAAERTFANLVAEGSPGAAPVTSVSIDSFQMFGISPALGRGFVANDYKPGATKVTVISDRFWREKFQSSPAVLGREVLIDEQSYNVIGVLAGAATWPQGFHADAFRPLVIADDPARPNFQLLTVIGRLNPGVTHEQATAALSAVTLTGLPAVVDYFSRRKPIVDGLSPLFPTKPYWLLLAGGLLLYASACLNAMNLMMTRLLGRQRELGIRLALGGSRWRVARLLLIESLGLALTAGLIVALVWNGIFPPLTTLLHGGNFSMDSTGRWWAVDWRTLGVAVGLSAVAGVTVALVPLWRLLRNDLNTAIKEGGPGHGESRRMARLRSGLVVLQATFAMILLIGTGLMVRSFEKIDQVELGFNPAGIVKVSVNFPRNYNPAPEARLQLFERITHRLEALPGVEQVTYGSSALLDGEWQGEELKLPDGTINRVAGHWVSADFAQVAGLTLMQGRWFAARTGAKAALTEVVLNQTAARQLFGDRDPLGEKIPGRKQIVVGVVRDVRGGIREPVGMHYYGPNWIVPQNIRTIVLRLAAGSPKEFAGLVQRAIYEVDSKLIVSGSRTIDDSINGSLWSERFAYSTLKVLTPIGLGLAVVGLFSVMAFNVEARTKEFGVRMALGATPANLYRTVIKGGVTTVAIGVLAGAIGALCLARFMQSLLFETAPYDPAVLASVGGLMLAAAAIACWLPARRAARVDPVVALRAE